MSQIVTAIFDGQVFKPDAAVSLPDQTRVRLVVDRLDNSNGPADEEIGERTQEQEETSGLLKKFDQICDEYPVFSTEPHLTRDQLHERR